MNLDDKKIYKKFDVDDVEKSIELLPDQMWQVLKDFRLVKIPKEYSKVLNVVVSGMGGSNLGAYIVHAAWGNKIKVPITICSGYEVPAFVNSKTLFILSSYSGTTEETLSTYKIAKKRGCKIIGITSKGKENKLEKLMIKENIPGYIFKHRYNYSGQPRFGLGRTVFGLAMLISKSGLFSINLKTAKEIVGMLEIWDRKLRPIEPSKINLAKKLAKKIHGHIPVFVGSEFLNGNLHTVRNQVCESSKNFATYLSLPDLNHFALEGLTHPIENKKGLIFVFFNSKLYHPRIIKRALLTEEVVKKNGIKTTNLQLKGGNKLIQTFELLQFGTWLSYYLGILNEVNPIKIPWVDWFKKQLK